MKLLPLFLAAASLLLADWNAVALIPRDRKIEVTTRDGATARVDFVSSVGESLVIRDKAGERTLAHTEIRKVRVFDSGRRIRQGLIWMGIGAAVGAGGGLAACPSCANEGSAGKFVGPGAAIGAAVSALGFLSSPWKTVYKGK